MTAAPQDPKENRSIPSGRLAAVDFGTKRIGVAVSDVGQSIASPLVGYALVDESQDARWFESLAKNEEISAWVVGLPVYPSGDESPKSKEARVFAAWLQRVTSRPVYLFDERYSTAQANEYLDAGNFSRKRKQDRRDMLAAQVILAAFLESTNRGGTTTALDDTESSAPDRE